MIANIKGRIIHKTPESVIIDVGGIGYEVFIPLSTFYTLPDTDEAVSLSVHTHVREDAIQLYGFLTREEKEVFNLLISVSGIGPRLARNILSGVPVGDLIAAISTSDRARLGKIPGIGAKSAERLILELKDKIAGVAVKAAPVSSQAEEMDQLTKDVSSALENLGYKAVLAEEAVKKARASLGEGAAFEAVLKESLKFLAKK